MSRIPTPRFRSLPGSRQLNSLAASIPEIRGDGNTLVSRTGNRINVGAANNPYPMFPVMPVRIISSTLVGANRWEYQVERISKSDEGYALLEPFPSEYDGTAYNMLEVGNSDSGLQGNGVNIEDLPAGFSIGPAPSGQFAVSAFIWMLSNENQTPELWFAYPNPVVGACDV
jgi:hypothetical protein